jgi:hypothetical protein
MAVLRLGSTSKRPRLAAAIASALLVAILGAATLAQASSASANRPTHGRHAQHRHYGISKLVALKTRHRRHRSRFAKTTPPSNPAGVLFRGAHLRDFWLNQSAPGAITEVPDPAGSGEGVFKFTVGDNDELNITPNPRGELLSPNTIEAGDEIWWSAKFFLPSDFPSSTPNFVTLLQGPYGPPWDGTPPFHIEVNGGVIKWQRNATYDWDIPWQMPLVRNKWVSFVIHERFGSDGWIEMWVNGQPITFFAGGTVNPSHVAPTQHLGMATEDSSNSDKPNSIYLQSYRKKGMYESLTVYQGPLTIGTTRASVGG